MTTAPGLVVAVDVGGTRLKGALVDDAATVVHAEQRPTPRDHCGDAVVDAVVALVADLADRGRREGARVPAAGVVVPGILDEDAGVAVLAANLGWRDLPLRKVLDARLGLPVALGHDVRAGGLAEVTLGAARGVRDALFVPVGTGIAAALVVDGRPVTGAGFAGEIGHVVVDPAGEVCGCGQRGCLETVASAAAVVRRFSARTGRVASGGEIARLAEDDDPDARPIWDDAVDALSSVLATCVTVLGTEVVILGGGLAEAGDVLLDPVRRALHARLTFQRRPTVVRAALGDQAGCLGAALLAWERTR